MSCFIVRLSAETSYQCICNFSKLKSVGNVFLAALGPPVTGQWLATFPHPCCRSVTLCVVGNKVPCEALWRGQGGQFGEHGTHSPGYRKLQKASSNYENRP